jgi:spermidine/putrescine transport system permease protein
MTTRRRLLPRGWAPYLLGAPGGFWLLAFFVVPIVMMASVSLQTGDLYEGFRMTWNFSTYADVFQQYHVQFTRSLVYASTATVVTFLISYPLAYWIAFRGGRHKMTYLFLLLLPFLVSFVIRTLMWNWILADDGVILGALKNLHLLPRDFHILATATSVMAGIAYNFLPFMALPLFVSLEKIDRSVVEAARDLYADNRQVFLKVILPLSLPGIFAGVLLTFVPAAVLGGTSTTMIGNIIQLEYLTNFRYPVAAALSFILMAVLLVLIAVYARVLGSRSIEEYI